MRESGGDDGLRLLAALKKVALIVTLHLLGVA